MTSNIVPWNSITVFVVQHGQTGLVVEFLQSFNGNSNVEFSFNRTFFDTFEVVGLGSSSSVTK